MRLLVCLLALFSLCSASNGASVIRRTPRSYSYTYRGNPREPKKAFYKKIVYVYASTIAEISRSPVDRSLKFCKLTELSTGSECEIEVKKLNRPVRNICLKKMMALINECKDLKNEEQIASEANIGDDTSFFTGLTSGIFPGTKWCGSSNRAKNYFDVGSKTKLDKCCRAHDHCPIKVTPFSHGFGERNWLLYTKSHCDCDLDFFNCLLSLNSGSADLVGDLYFNALKIPCLKEAPGVDVCPVSVKPDDNCPTAFIQDNIVLKTVEVGLTYPLRNLSEHKES